MLFYIFSDSSIIGIKYKMHVFISALFQSKLKRTTGFSTQKGENGQNNLHALKMSKFFSLSKVLSLCKTFFKLNRHRRTQKFEIFWNGKCRKGNKSLKTNWKFNILIFFLLHRKLFSVKGKNFTNLHLPSTSVRTF